MTVALAAATGLSLATPAIAMGVGQGTSADGWIRYRAPVIAGAQQITVQGSVDEFGDCDIPLEAVLPANKSAISYDEIAFNPQTCESKVLLTDTVDDVDEPGNESAAEEGATTPEPVVGATGDVGIQAVRSSGYLKSYYEDPVQLDVNSVKNTTTWSWNGSRVLSSPGPTGGYNYGWYSPSGWSKKENDWRNTYTSAQTTSSSFVHYKNGRFCLTIDTHTRYNRNTVHGKANGDLVGKWNAKKSGGCTNLLSFHHKLKRTKN